MFPDARVKELLDCWRQSMEREQPISIEELCRDCPELRSEVERLIALEEARAREAALPTTVETLFQPVPPPTSTLLPQVPDYEVLEELGHGGMGVVYKARQIHLNRIVALKMIRAGALAAPEQRLRFLAEAKAAAAIEHPGIVRVFDFGTYQGQPFFASELCPNGSLARLLQGQPLTPERAAALVEQIANAVEAAHQRGIVHRDLKPTNILLDGAEQPKIADFGLAKHMEGSSDLTPSGAIMGTRSYMAPEQAQARKDVGPLADVWALGAILYECLTGRPPFRAATDYDTIMQVVCDEPVPVRKLQPSVPRDLEAVCLKCLEKTPCHRYASASALAEELRRFQQGESVHVRPAKPHKRAVRWLKKHAWAGAAVAGIALALVAGLILGGGRPSASTQGQGAQPLPEVPKIPKTGDQTPIVPKGGEESALVRQIGRLLDTQWQPRIDRLAREIVKVLREQKQTSLVVNEITGWVVDRQGRQAPSPISKRLQQAIARELDKHKAVSESAEYILTGGWSLEETAAELRLYLEVAVRNRKGIKIIDLPVVLVVVRDAPLDALLQRQLQPAAARLARQIADRVAKEKLKDLDFGEVTGPPGSNGVGPRIQQALIAEVKKLGVPLGDSSRCFVKGEYVLIEGAEGQREDEVILRLEITLRNRKGDPLRLPPLELRSRDP